MYLEVFIRFQPIVREYASKWKKVLKIWQIYVKTLTAYG